MGQGGMVFIVGILYRSERESLRSISGSISGRTGMTTIWPQRRSSAKARGAESQPFQPGAGAAFHLVADDVRGSRSFT